MYDFINSLLQLGAAFVMCTNIYKTHKEGTKGVSLIHPTFFSGVGLWYVFYFHWLNQSLSFVGAILGFVANVVWLMQLFYLSGAYAKCILLLKSILTRLNLVRH